MEKVRKERIKDYLYPQSAMLVSCKDTTIPSQYSVANLGVVINNRESVIFNSREIEELVWLFENNRIMFIETLIKKNLEGKKISSFVDSSKPVLSNHFSSNQNRSFIEINTDNYKLQFNGLAITKFKSLILKLEKQSKNDIFELVSDDIVSKKAKNLRLLLNTKISNNEFTRTRYYNHTQNSFLPDCCTEYSIRTDLKDNITKDELDNMRKLIDKFVLVNGKFDDYHVGYNSLYAYVHNIGSVTIEGNDIEYEFLNKILEKKKKEEGR